MIYYEGWTKSPISLTKTNAANAHQRFHAKGKGKKRAGASSRAKGASSSSKGKRRRVVDSDPESESDYMDEGAKEHEEERDWCSYVNEYDVCITTFNILQQDLNVARAPPTRPRREVAAYTRHERPRSPLIICEWYRVIMDEVQMVGGGKAE